MNLLPYKCTNSSSDLKEYVVLQTYVNEKISPTFAKQEDDQKVERDDD